MNTFSHLRQDFRLVIKDFIQFVISPKEYWNIPLERVSKTKVFISILLIKLIFLCINLPFLTLIEDHIPAYESNKWSSYPLILIIIEAVVLAPLIEEWIFRFPLHYKRNIPFKWINYWIGNNRAQNFFIQNYKVILYFMAIAFGLVHIFNYVITSPYFYFFAFVLVLSQMLSGFTLSYLRNGLGVWYSVLMHGVWNFIVIFPLFFSASDQLIEIKNEKYYLKIAEANYSKNNIQTNDKYEQGKILDSVIVYNVPLEEALKNLDLKVVDYKNLETRVFINYTCFERDTNNRKYLIEKIDSLYLIK